MDLSLLKWLVEAGPYALLLVIVLYQNRQINRMQARMEQSYQETLRTVIDTLKEVVDEAKD